MPPLVGEVVMSPPKRAPTDTRLPNPDSTPRPSEKTPGPPFSSASAPRRSESGGTARAGSARARAATQTATGRARRIRSLLRIRSVPWHGGAADFLGGDRRFGLPVVCGGGTPLSPMLFFAFLLLAQPTPIGPPSATQRPALAAEGPAGWREEVDELWRHRDESRARKKLEQDLDEIPAVDPRAFEANWRLAALYNWEADAKETDEKAALGKKAWE